MKMRDIVFEARRLLMSPGDIPAGFRHSKLMNLAQEYGRRLTERLQSAPSCKLLGPRDVVLQVVPKVLQGFWSPPRSTFLNMPSQKLNQMAVGVTMCVLDKLSNALSNVHHQVTFSGSIRDAMVLSIQEKVRQMYPAQDIRRRELNSFAAQILNTIADAAASEMCALVEPQSNTHVVENSSNKTNCSQLADVVDGAETIHTLAGDLNEELGLEEDREQGPAVTLALPTPHDGPVVMTAAQDERTIRKREVKRKRRVQPFLVQKQSDAAACLKTQTENDHWCN
ncbi:hypothetical protein NQZ68_000518 [Dissostichus eleginoides]|nr:hypothetical protein NQZ68_000518 [Dissostichus eleginoides]